MRLYSIYEQLDVKTLTLKQLASKHDVSIDEIVKQLEMGIKVEQEHTTNKAAAKKIALGHLKEDPKYYSKLKKAKL